MSFEEIKTKNEQIEDYINELATGDKNAMGGLYELIKTDVYAFALSKVQNPTVAEDIMQDTFVKIYKYAPQYTPSGKPLAWVFTIITNLAINIFNSDKRYEPMDETTEEMPDEKDSYDNVLNSMFLKQLMKTLKPEEQQVIVMHIISGLKHTEIAKILKEPLSTILSRYNRAIKKLQKTAKETEKNE